MDTILAVINQIEPGNFKPRAGRGDRASVSDMPLTYCLSDNDFIEKHNFHFKGD